ncbi:MAG: hypothetical protein FWC47_05955 [Oscillospiraceae bacterium]|nr:hypothetical protein [Oscillospiraceae bacterium]
MKRLNMLRKKTKGSAMIIALIFFSIIASLVLVNFNSLVNFSLFSRVFLDSFAENDYYNKAYYEIFDAISAKILDDNPELEDFDEYIKDNNTKISLKGADYTVTKIANSNRIIISFTSKRLQEIFSIDCVNNALKFCKFVKE